MTISCDVAVEIKYMSVIIWRFAPEAKRCKATQTLLPMGIALQTFVSERRIFGANHVVKNLKVSLLTHEHLDYQSSYHSSTAL
ncbi:hypothetical protein GOP47_0013865 [Adiantum capillus-veneris]|uniref:Uncharacterized protein n=1 Tax=Adiantum capillus-veneris TaxID=13818 RepID=A0A9D4UPC0_ADICA|nr:hypothetical protein GOP47_0013865 [Adiantum capillus-veneris]